MNNEITKGPDELHQLDEFKNLWTKLNQIEAKNKCVRVQFLDWLSDKLLSWSNIVHEAASRIDSPCIIKVEPRKKADNKHAINNEEIVRMQAWIKEETKH